jgi:dihydroflavonol-4-reductase
MRDMMAVSVTNSNRGFDMRVAVTGAAGMLGANLVRRLLADNHDVRALVYGDQRSLDGLDIEKIECDVRDYDKLRDSLRGCERVFNLAAVITAADGKDDFAEDVNENGPRNVAKACMELGVERLLHCSSVHALHPNEDGTPLDETCPLSMNPGIFPYDRSKAKGQAHVQAAVKEGLDAVIVNPTAVLGPYDYNLSSSSRGLVDLYRGKVPAIPAGGFDFVDARDVCEGILAAVERGRTGEHYLLGGQYYTMMEMTRMFAEVAGCRPPMFEIPIWMLKGIVMGASLFPRRNGQVAVLTHFTIRSITAYKEVSHEKAVRELGYTSRPIPETMQYIYEWFREAGTLN